MCACIIQALQQADSTQAEVSRAAGQAAAAWAEVEALESKGDAAGAAASAAEAVALQQQAQQRQAAASAAAAQAQRQVHSHFIFWAAQQSSPLVLSLSVLAFHSVGPSPILLTDKSKRQVFWATLVCPAPVCPLSGFCTCTQWNTFP